MVVRCVSNYETIVPRGERFTNEDKRHLIEYIAIKIPKAEDGGRSGDTIYKRLEQLGRVRWSYYLNSELPH